MSLRKLPENMAVLVVEDEALVAMHLTSLLEDLGCTVIGPAMRYDLAEQMVEAGVSADLAVLDVNLAGRPVFGLAEKLLARGIPVLFATGYGRGGIPEEWQEHPVLQKPYTEHDLSVLIEEIFADTAAHGR